MKIKRHDLKGFFPSQTRCDRFSIVFSSEMARVLMPSAALDVFECICMYFAYVPAAEYGSVICDGVEMADIPSELQEARVFKLHLRNNGLHRFPDAKLQGTGNVLTFILYCLTLKLNSCNMSSLLLSPYSFNYFNFVNV